MIMPLSVEEARMDKLREFVEADISKEQALYFGRTMAGNAEVVEILWRFVQENKTPLSWRAMWYLEHLCEQDREVLRPLVPRIIEQLPHFKHDGQKRSGLKTIAMFPLSGFDYGPLLTVCFDFLLDSGESIAVRSLSMQQLYEICRIEPELSDELRQSILHILPEASKGIQAKARHILGKL